MNIARIMIPKALPYFSMKRILFGKDLNILWFMAIGNKQKKQSLGDFNTASNNLLPSLLNQEYHKDLIKIGYDFFAGKRFCS